MPKMESLKEHRFGRRDYVVGECFEATEREAKMVIALGRAKLATYETRVLVAEDPQKAEPRQKRKYTRRDLQARN